MDLEESDQLAATGDQEAGWNFAGLIERGRALLVATVPPFRARRSRGANVNESRPLRSLRLRPGQAG